MSRATVLARGRAAAEAGMVDTATIRRRTGETTDPNTGVITPTYSTLYSGKCLVQQSPLGARAHAMNVGEAELLMVPRHLHLPVATSAGIRAGDEVEITAAVSDPDLVGRQFVVHDEYAKTWATSRRLGIEERTS